MHTLLAYLIVTKIQTKYVLLTLLIHICKIRYYACVIKNICYTEVAVMLEKFFRCINNLYMGLSSQSSCEVHLQDGFLGDGLIQCTIMILRISCFIQQLA